MKHPLIKKLIPVLSLFIFVNILLLIFKSILTGYGFDVNFILGANVVLFLLSLSGFFIQTKGVHSSNINDFIRGVYSSVLLKMFIIMAAILIYILAAGGNVNKPALFTSMAIYILYTSVEVIQLMKIVRKKPNA
ncbi:MAG TPA: hypothetical protein VJ279_00370 [Hanamia sp.]|nr:hypothetical protein [Hanamia sp.]